MPPVVEKKSTAPSVRADIAIDAARAAISERFSNVPGRMDIRPLWEDSNGSYFRVNWWHVSTEGPLEVGPIHLSAFVRVRRDGKALCVEDRTQGGQS